jgi:hypothetical protein
MTMRNAGTFLIIVSLFLNGCTSINSGKQLLPIDATVTTRPIQTLPISTLTRMPTQIAASPSSTVTEIPILTSVIPNQVSPQPTAVSNPLLPDVLINYGVNIIAEEVGGWDSPCNPADYNQILLSSYPYSTARIFLKDPNINFNFPVWSPNGEWIAYVVSQPNIINGTVTNGLSGTDNVWISRPDGTGNKQIGQSFSSVDEILSYGGCRMHSGIFGPLNWSKDGKYLLVLEQNWSSQDLGSVYLINVETGKTSLVLPLTQGDVDFTPIWMADRDSFAIQGENSIQLVDVQADESIKITSIPRPPIMRTSSMLFNFVPSKYAISEGGNQIVYGIFFLEPVPWDPPTNTSLWKLNINQKKWSKVISNKNGVWTTWAFNYNWALMCYSNTNYGFLNVFDIKTWQTHLTASSQFNTAKPGCGTLRSIQNRDGLFSFMDSYYEHQEQGIWLVDINQPDSSPKLIVDETKLNLASDYQKAHILEYEWKP